MEAKLRGTTIYFDIAGMQLVPAKDEWIERPVIFVLHGGPGGDHLRFKLHSLELQLAAQVVFIDHRGCGRSKKTRQSDYTLDNNIEDIEALRKHLGFKKICILGGSYGGIVAQGYAIRYPEHVEKLILAATAPSYRFLEIAKKNLQARGNKKQIAITEHLWNGTFKNPKHVEKFFRTMDSIYSYKAKHQKKNVYAKTHTIWSHEALNEGFGNFLRKYDFLPTLNRIKCPTLILAGDRDWICDPSQAKIMAKKIPKAKLKIFKQCGHAVATDAHKSYIKEILTFLKK